MMNLREKLIKELETVNENLNSYIYEKAVEEANGDVGKVINRQNELQSRFLQDADLFFDNLFKERIEKEVAKIEDEDDYEIRRDELTERYLELSSIERIEALSNDEIKNYIDYIKELKENYEFDKKEREFIK